MAKASILAFAFFTYKTRERVEPELSRLICKIKLLDQTRGQQTVVEGLDPIGCLFVNKVLSAPDTPPRFCALCGCFQVTTAEVSCHD